VTVDSLRADHLGCYTGGARSTPGFDALATAGVRFTRAYAASASTAPSTASVLTGLYPLRHGLRDDLSGMLARDTPTLAGLLKAQGFATAAIAGTIHLNSDHGFERGFDHFDEQIKGIKKLVVLTSKERRAAEVVDAGLKALDALPVDRPAFLWLSLHDPHFDYEAPEPQKTQFTSNPYDGEVAYTDTQITALAEGLHRRDPEGRMTLVIAGTHGEGLGEHQETGHGTYLYESTIRVPLIVVPGGPGGARGTTVNLPVSLVDLAPTLLDLSGLEVPKGFDGLSLAALVRQAAPDKVDAAAGRDSRAKRSKKKAKDDGAASASGPGPDRRLFVEAMAPRLVYGWSALYAVIQGNHKVVQGARLEAFDLAADPGEAKPLAEPPAWAAEMAAAGAPLLGPLDPPEARRRAILDAADSLDLPWADSPFCVPKMNFPDPRDPDRVALNERLFMMRIESEQGIVGTAAKRAQEVLPADPANLTALDLEIVLGLRNHWGDMLLDPLETLQCNYPYQGIGYHYLGHFYLTKSDHEKALKVFTVFAMVEPWADEGEYDIACELAALDRKDEAFDHLRKSIGLGGHDFDFMRKDPRLMKLRGDPRFEDVLGSGGH
jgi:hypothetical protein